MTAATTAPEASTPAAGDDDARTVRRVVFGVLGLQLVLLTVTGVALFFWYRPGTGSGAIVLTRVVHRWVSVFMVPSSIVGAVLLARPKLEVGRLATGAGLVVGTLAAAFTGFLLPWDQLALWAVEIGERLEGYGVLFDDKVRFVLVGGTEMGPDTVLRWLAVHLVLGLALAGLLVLGARTAVYGAERAQKPEG